MRDQMTLGDLILFYHSSTTPPGVAGIARVASESYPDPSQFKVGGQYYDAKSSKKNPRWWLVDVEFVEKFPLFITLASLRDDPAFDGMWLLRRGMRLSVQPVEPDHFARIVRLGGGKTRIRHT
jgi:predicted RNA-binding protein with PUA-like domain